MGTLVEVVPGHRNERGYWIDPMSDCCKAPLVYYHRGYELYVTWPGLPSLEPPVELFCRECMKVVYREVKP